MRGSCKRALTKKSAAVKRLKSSFGGGGGWRDQVLLLEDSGLEIEFVPVSQHSVHNRNTNHQYQHSPCPHTTTSTNFYPTLSTLHTSTSWRVPNEKAVQRLESLFSLTHRHATYFPGQWSTFLCHYFSPLARESIWPVG